MSPHRKTKATETTNIFICLVLSILLMNFAFLINNFVAEMKNLLGCKIMAAVMHCFMLATFTWFAAQGFHICLQMYKGGQVVIKRYILKVSVTSWSKYMPVFYPPETGFLICFLICQWT